MKVMSSGVAGYGEDGLASARRRKSIQSVIQWLTQLALQRARSGNGRHLLRPGNRSACVSAWVTLRGLRA